MKKFKTDPILWKALRARFGAPLLREFLDFFMVYEDSYLVSFTVKIWFFNRTIKIRVRDVTPLLRTLLDEG